MELLTKQVSLSLTLGQVWPSVTSRLMGVTWPFLTPGSACTHPPTLGGGGGVKGRGPPADGLVLVNGEVSGNVPDCCFVPLSPGLEQRLLDRVRHHADQRHPGEGKGQGAVWSQQGARPALPSPGPRAWGIQAAAWAVRACDTPSRDRNGASHGSGEGTGLDREGYGTPPQRDSG